MSTKTLRVLYWIATLLFVLPQTWSAVQMLSEAPRMTQTITELGYPIYVMKILGVAKLLGAAAILYGRIPLLKEWAYAGFTFDVIGAFASHIAAGDPFYIALVPLVFFAVQLVSYLLWKRLEGGAIDSALTPRQRAKSAGAPRAARA
jgi:hypothetical protein